MNSLNTAARARARYNWIVVVSVAIGVPLFSLLKYRSGTSEKVILLSAGITLLLLLPIMVWTLHQGHQRMGGSLPKAVIVGAVILGLVSFAVTWAGATSMRQHNSLGDLAASNTPLESIQPERDRILVQLFRRLAANSRKNNVDLAEAQKHVLNPQIYSPESFASKAAMISTIEQLTKYIDLDVRYANQQKAAMGDFKKQMAVCDPEYLKSFEENREKSGQAQSLNTDVETQWFAGAKALYGYAEDHSADIKVTGGKIGIASEPVRTEFNRELQQSETAHDAMVERVQHFAKEQQAAKDKYMNP